MPPTLRARKSTEALKPEDAAPKAAAAKASPKPKRKATEEASPVSLKKQKSSKKTAVEKKSTKKEATPKKPVKKADESEAAAEEEKKAEEQKKEKKQKGTKKKEEKVEEKSEEPIEVQREDATELEEEQDDEELQVLALDLDPEDEKETNEEMYKPGQDVGKIPKVSKEVQKAAHASSNEGSGVIYIGRIPHGFYESQMKQYLSQFGPITRLRLSRNKKTGASKHFAFVEFEEASTAEIVAKTMDNYLLFGHILKCKTVAKESLHDDVWKGANRRFKKVPWNKMAGKQLEKPRTESAWANKVAKERSSRAKKAAKLKEIGYEFENPQLKKVPAPVAIENGQDTDTKAIEAAPEPEMEVDAVAESGEAAAAVEDAKPEAEPKVEATPNSISASKKATKVAKAKATKATRPKRAKA